MISLLGNKTILSIGVFCMASLLGWGANGYWHSNRSASEQSQRVELTQLNPDDRLPSVNRVAQEPEHTPPALIKNDEPSYQADSNSIIEYLSERGKEQHYTAMKDKALRNLVYQTPGLAKNLLEELINLEESETKRNLNSLLLGVQLVKRAGLDDLVLEQIKLGERRSDWMNVLGELGIHSIEGIEYINEGLTTMTDQDELLAAIKAISGPATDHFLPISPDVRKSIAENLHSHLDARDDDVRSAAVSALQNYPTGDLEKSLLAASDDPSFKVRESARQVFISKAGFSEALKEKTMSSLQNTSLEMYERLNLASSLGVIKLSLDEQRIVTQISDELKSTYESFDENQKIDYQKRAARARGL